MAVDPDAIGATTDGQAALLALVRGILCLVIRCHQGLARRRERHIRLRVEECAGAKIDAAQVGPPVTREIRGRLDLDRTASASESQRCPCPTSGAQLRRNGVRSETGQRYTVGQDQIFDKCKAALRLLVGVSRDQEFVAHLDRIADPTEAHDARYGMTFDQPFLAVFEFHPPINVGIGPVEFGDGPTHLEEIVELEIGPGVVAEARVADYNQDSE